MTTVYGVTFIGAREQIEKQLKDRRDIPEEECWPAASYLAKKVSLPILRTVLLTVFTTSYFIDPRMYRRSVQRRQRHSNMA